MDQAEVCERDVVRSVLRADSSKGEMIFVRVMYFVRYAN